MGKLHNVMVAISGKIGTQVLSLRRNLECHPALCFYCSLVQSMSCWYFSDILSCVYQYTCAVTCQNWYECKHIRKGRVKKLFQKRIQYAAQFGFGI